jgi:hypothetical protein
MTKPRSAHEHYRREVERRAKQVRPESEIMAAARREYEALLEAQATKGKGGRPRKKVAKKAKADDEFDLGAGEAGEGTADED